MIYAYSKPNTMEGHRFADDAAVCVAETKEEALNKFHKLYGDAQEEDITECDFDSAFGGVVVLTDY